MDDAIATDDRALARAEDALRWRSQLDRLLTEVSTCFIDLTAGDIDAAVQDGLARVSDFIGAERGYVVLADDDSNPPVAAWIRPGAEADPELDLMPHGSVEAWHERLNRGETIELSPSTRDPWVVVLPMHANGHFLGRIEFATTHRTRRWRGVTAAALRPLGCIFAQAFAYQRLALDLEESEGRYRSLVEEVRDVIVRVDGAGRISFVNHAWTELTGLTLEETLQRNAFESVHPDDQLIAAEHIASLANGGDDRTRSVRFIAKDGSFRWMEVEGRALFDDEGNFDGLNGVLHDVTDSKLAEATIRAALDEAIHAREEAERSSRAKSEFLSRMSHELRTPLNAILGFTELLQYAELGEEDAHGLRLIMQAGRHLLHLINDALDISRMETGQLALSLEPVPIVEVWSESLDLLRSDAAARDLTIEPPAPADARIRVVADRIRLKQVLVNLLSNAVKYNRDSGSVTVACRALEPGETPASGEQRFARITVTDTGIGVPADQLSDVFVPFHRLGAELTDVEGTGVGLALTKSLVEAMGGHIGLTSTFQVGSTFFVDLPIADATWA